MEEKRATKEEVIETEIQMGTVHPAALEPYRVRFFVEDEIIKDKFLNTEPFCNFHDFSEKFSNYKLEKEY